MRPPRLALCLAVFRHGRHRAVFSVCLAQAGVVLRLKDSGAESCRWLIVLDDVTDPADLNGLWPPASPHGRILVTTRRRDAAHGRHTIARWRGSGVAQERRWGAVQAAGRELFVVAGRVGGYTGCDCQVLGRWLAVVLCGGVRDVLVEAMTVLAAAGGGAVAQAAGTDAWNGLRRRVADLFGRGDAARQRAELERLDHTAQVLAPGASADLARERVRQEGLWQGRFEALLESLDADGRERAAGELRELLVFVADSAGDAAVATGKAVARDGGVAVTGIKRADGGLSGPAKAVGTGDAEADGPGSSAVSGIVSE